MFFFISYIGGNKSIRGKILKNKSLEQCYYSDNYDLCIPKDFEANCYLSDVYKTCEEENESSNGQCGEGIGKCPSGQCCNKDGKCGSTEDFCLIRKNCQSEYGDCIDECEEIFDILKNTYKIKSRTNIMECNTDEQGKAEYL